jgi:hypothetical protein
MSQRVRRNRFDQSGSRRRHLDRPLNRLLVEMMATNDAGARIDRATRCGEDVLPPPLLSGLWIFDVECVRHFDFAEAFRQIRIMQTFDHSEMVSKWKKQILGQHGHAILRAFAFSHNDFPTLELNVFHAQAQSFK